MTDNFEEEKKKFLIELNEIQSMRKFRCFESNILEKYSNEIRSNKDLVLLLLSTTNNVFMLKYISEQLSKDKDFFLKTVKLNSCSFYYAYEDLKKDEEFILKLIKKKYFYNRIYLSIIVKR